MAKKAAAKTKDVEEPKDERPLILGVAVTGHLEDVDLNDIYDPDVAPDRLGTLADDAQIKDLARSMREVGQIQPVMLEKSEEFEYVRVFGRRRIAAARLAGLQTVRAIVVPPLKPDQRRTIVAVENIQRKQLSPIEEHLGVWELCELQVLDVAISQKRTVPYGKNMGHTLTPEIVEKLSKAEIIQVRQELMAIPQVRTAVCEAVSAMLAKDPTWVRDRLYIGRLGDEGRRLVLEGKLPLTHAREICKMADPKRREDLAVKYAVGGSESLSEHEPGLLDDLKDDVTSHMFSLAQVPWRTDRPFGGRMACDGCPHNSAENPGLFDHGGTCSTEIYAGEGRGHKDVQSASVEKAGVCTWHVCFADKMSQAKTMLTSAAKQVEAGKSPKPEATEVLKPTAIKARVSERGHLSANRPNKTPPKMKPTQDQEALRIKHKAEDELRAALRQRCEKYEPAIVKKVLATPGLWSVLRILQCTKLYEATCSYDHDKAKKAAQVPGLRHLVNLLKDPSWNAIVEMEESCGRRFGVLDKHADGASGVAEMIFDALGIETEPVPTLEDFMPKPPKPAAASKASGTSEAATSTKSSGKKESPAAKKPSASRPARQSQIVDDGEDD
jgi:hypothetical protein